MCPTLKKNAVTPNLLDPYTLSPLINYSFSIYLATLLFIFKMFFFDVTSLFYKYLIFLVFGSHIKNLTKLTAKRNKLILLEIIFCFEKVK